MSFLWTRKTPSISIPRYNTATGVAVLNHAARHSLLCPESARQSGILTGCEAGFGPSQVPTWYLNCSVQFIDNGGRAFHTREQSTYIGNFGGSGKQGCALGH